MSRIDLHTHSTVSDGTDTPEELVAAAAAAGVRTLALTDHDSTGGWERAAAALPAGMRLVRGAEFSCDSPDGRGGLIPVHILGYLFDAGHPAVVAEQARLREERVRRLTRMAENIAADFPLDPAAMFGYVPEGATPGRPHLGRALIDAGVVGSMNEAFTRLLHNDSPYYVPKADTPVGTALRMIREAGGVAVFAHPLARTRGRVVEPSVIADLAGEGLAGVEVDHPDHSPGDRALLRGLAGDLGLIVTGASDYHGANKTTPLAAETTDPEQCEELLAKATGVEVICA